jgi:hypothetical protein
MALQSAIYNYSATITAYNGVTKVATLDTPVEISLGYNTTLGQLTSQYTLSGNNTSVLAAIKDGTKPQQLSTDENGSFYGILNVPPGTFKVGSRVFRLDNRTVATDSSTATTYAEATFTAAGLSTTSQALQFSPSVDSSSNKFTPTQYQSQSQINTIASYTQFDPVAQSFIVSKDNYQNGIFILSVKLFFATKPTTTNSPVVVSIVPTLNGYPNGSALDYSTVALHADQIITSSSPHFLDASTYTEFMFKAPVYLKSGETYAILIQTSSPDYTVYYAQQNSVAIGSTAKALPTDANPSTPTKIGAVPQSGAFFESQNGTTWTADLTKDLMFVIDRCVFDISTSREVDFVVPQGMPKRKLLTSDIQYKLNPDLVNGIYRSAGGSQRLDAMNITTTDFVPTSAGINYQYTSTLRDGNVVDVSRSVIPGKYGSPNPDNIYFDDGLKSRILLANSNSSFTLAATMYSSDDAVSPIISDDGITLFNIRYAINNMNLSNPTISIANTGTGYNVNAISVTVSSPDIGSDIAVCTANVQSGNVVGINVTYGGSGYLTSPTITVSDAATRINGNANCVIVVSGETSPSGGNALAKYFTKKVVLGSGQDSGDLRVYYSAYKPLGTAVYVYYKILSSNDTQKFEEGNWQLMTQVGPQNVYSDNRDNIIEYECAPGVYGSGAANNNISYTGINGQTYNNFIQFAIKVVMATSDTTKVPVIEDIRALALPSGTGI